MILRTDEAGSAVVADVTVNNDTGANYDRQYLVGTNATAAAGVTLAGTAWNVSAHGSGGSAGYASTVRMSIPGYTQTTFNKVAEVLDAMPDATAGNNIAIAYALGWRSTAAITRMKVAAQGAANLKAGSRLLILGVG